MRLRGASWGVLNCADNLLQDFNRRLQLRTVRRGKRGDLFCQGAHTALAAQHQQFLPRGGRGDMRSAAIQFIPASSHEPLLFQSVHDPRHGGWTNLLGRSETAKGQRAGKDNHGQGRQSGSIQATRRVFPAKLAQEVDGFGVNLIGNDLRIG